MSRKANFFWASYADLMTSLFFIMLVLFILTVVMLKKEQGRIITKLEEYEKIDEINKALNAINPDYFEYRPEFKKHIFKLAVEFPKDSFAITSITNQALLEDIEKAGREIQNAITNFTNDDNVQYLVIIEGQASRDGYWADNYKNNDVLSYQRALHLKKFWETRGIYLDMIGNCELIVAGSGEGGIPREIPDDNLNTSNRRFLIHVIPKTGEIDKNN
jgi:outer membrane protein OmpA-like peptidoglycan-associated protein